MWKEPEFESKNIISDEKLILAVLFPITLSPQIMPPFNEHDSMKLCSNWPVIWTSSPLSNQICLRQIVNVASSSSGSNIVNSLVKDSDCFSALSNAVTVTE